MPIVLGFFWILSLVNADFVQVFPNSSMTSADLIYRSKYLSQSVNELEILFQAGPFGKNWIEITFQMPKYSYDYIEGIQVQNNTLPKSIGVNTTILLKDNLKDTSIWKVVSSSLYMRVFYQVNFDYFILKGIKSQRKDPNGNLCDSYTITCEFLIQGTENNAFENYGKLIGLVSLLLLKTSTASTTLQTVLLNLTEAQMIVNTSATSTFKACSSLVNDCSISQNIYKLNENAIFLLKLDDPQFHNSYYLTNLRVSMKIDNDSLLDVTPIINILSTGLGEVKFDLVMMMIPINSITISVVATLQSPLRRLESSAPQGIINYEVVYISEDTKTEVQFSNTIGYLFSLMLIMSILLVII